MFDLTLLTRVQKYSFSWRFVTSAELVGRESDLADFSRVGISSRSVAIPSYESVVFRGPRPMRCRNVFPSVSRVLAPLFLFGNCAARGNRSKGNRGLSPKPIQKRILSLFLSLSVYPVVSLKKKKDRINAKRRVLKTYAKQKTDPGREEGGGCGNPAASIQKRVSGEKLKGKKSA